MNYSTRLKLAMFCGILGLLATSDIGPLASIAMAQREDDEGERQDGARGEGRDDERGGRRRFRRDRGGEDEGRGRFRRRDRGNGDNDNGDRGRDNGDRESRSDENRSTIDISAWAKSRVRELDKNGNMMLEGDELRGLRGPAASADINGDKVVTVEELVARLSNRGSTAARPAQNDQSKRDAPGTSGGSATSATTKTRVYTGSAGGVSASADKTDQRRSHRFTPAAERLTANLPSWFKSRDRNGDGQVAMSEYSRSWSVRMVNEFRRYDRNDDGVITPKEVAK